MKSPLLATLAGRFGAKSHTGAMVNIYALGAGAEKFRGVFDNTEIYHKLAELTGVQ